MAALSEEGLDTRLAQRLPAVLRDALKAYQWVGAKYVVRRGGRGLIGDEMGAWVRVGVGGCCRRCNCAGAYWGRDGCVRGSGRLLP